jgi:phage I-like protein
LHARGIPLDAAFDDIQLMPPGTHEIEPMGRDGKPVKLTVTVTAATATALEAARARYQAEADAGTGDAPYIDFNHDDGPAAGWVKRIYWGGDDPKTGGIRAKIEWSDAGREAIEGKTFRRFSPSFLINANGQITDAPVNMGGLVNRAAFRSIAAFFAKSEQPTTPPNTPPTMTEEQIAALQKENEDLKARIAELEASVAAAAKDKAESDVECAAKEGRIAPAQEIKAKWVQAILTDPTASELLASLPVNPALQTVIHATATPPAEDDKSPAALKARYDAMADGPEKDKFRRENAAALLHASRSK